MKSKNLLLLAAAAGVMANGFGSGTFSGNKKCPNCGKPTMTGTVCNLRCAVALKQKQNDGVKP